MGNAAVNIPVHVFGWILAAQTLRNDPAPVDGAKQVTEVVPKLTLLPAAHGKFNGSTSPALGNVSLCNFSHSGGNAMVAHCGFSFAFTSLLMELLTELRTFLCYWLFCEMSIQVSRPILYWVMFVFYLNRYLFQI